MKKVLIIIFLKIFLITLLILHNNISVAQEIPVKVLVRQVGASTYAYKVINLHTNPIGRIQIGFNRHRKDSEEELTMVPTTIESPQGWEGKTIFLEESDYLHIDWVAESDIHPIQPGSSLDGFIVYMPETYDLMKQTYFTVIYGYGPVKRVWDSAKVEPEYTLTVTKAGTGSGTVTSSPSGISCGIDCSDAYNQGTLVTLKAKADAGSIFTGWSGGGCSDTGICTVTMDADKSVTATFTKQYTLTVTKAGTGSGTVTSSPSGISCGTDCSEPYNSNTAVTLTATADAGSVFTGWSGGGCSGTVTCTVTVDADKSVTATFTKIITVTVPNGGESWEAGKTYTIRWTYIGSPGSFVKIELLKGGSLNYTITSKTSIGSGGNGSYNWTSPATQAGGNDYKIRVTSTSNSSYTDTGDNNFTIIASSITVTVPNGGESWKTGTTQTIRWTYTANPGSNVKIELLKGGVLNRTIKSNTSIGSGGNGSYNWAIPSTQTAGTDYKIRITSISNRSITDTSDGDFTIYK